MKATLAVLALAGSAAAQAVTSLVVPSSTPPAGCENSRQGTFGLSVVNVTGTPSSPSPSRRDLNAGIVNLAPRQASGTLKMTLTGGVMKDQDGRTAYVASNYQFQFDNPPQAGAIYTAGFSICQNGSIAIGGKALWYQCLSGTFYNLYDRDWAAHCNAVYFKAVGGGALFSTAPPAAEITGPSEATIANGGGTQSMNATASATGVTNGTAATTGSGSMATGNSTGGSSGSGSSGSGSSGSGSGSSGSSKSSAGGAAAMATAAPQALFPLAMGVVGAIAML